MSIRLRLTLLYSAILALTLVIFSAALYTVQARTTLKDLEHEMIVGARRAADTRHYWKKSEEVELPASESPRPNDGQFSPLYFQVRGLDGAVLLRRPEVDDTVLPISEDIWHAVVGGEPRFEFVTTDAEHLLVYSQVVVEPDEPPVVIQVGRSLADRDRFLTALRVILTIGSSLAVMTAFGVGWVLAGLSLRPINRITQTAQTIGAERDFGRRVNHAGPNDEIGQLATTFNDMLAALQDAFRRVEQSLQVQQRFVADASHELRTPLTTLRGNLGLLQRQPPISSADQADVLADMVDETERLMRLTHDLLILARADARRPLRSEPVPIQPLLDEVCGQVRILAPQHTIRCNQSVESAAVGDRDALKQVLLALFDNAVKHTPPGTTITLTTAAVDERIGISIADDGPGIDPAQLPHIFDRFYRSDAARTGGGAGLGLAIARELTELQNGTITVESRLGQGTVFTLTFPRPPS